MAATIPHEAQATTTGTGAPTTTPRAPTGTSGGTDPVRLPGIARGGAFLIEPIGSRGIFITGEFTDEQLAYAEAAEEFVAKEVLPRLDAIEHKEEGLMVRLLKRAGELGLMMIDIPEQDGGLGL